MITLLDVTLSVITGMIVILTIIFSILNVNQMNYNLETMLTLHKHGTITLYWLEMYLETAGRNLSSTESVFNVATENSMRFNYKENFYDSDSQYYEINYVTTGVGRIEVSKNGGAVEYQTFPATLDMSPPPTNALQPIFTYFDEEEHVIPFPINTQDALDSIRSVRVDLIFSAPGWGKDDDLTVYYPITFWKYFKNIYIANAPASS